MVEIVRRPIGTQRPTEFEDLKSPSAKEPIVELEDRTEVPPPVTPSATTPAEVYPAEAASRAEARSLLATEMMVNTFSPRHFVDLLGGQIDPGRAEEVVTRLEQLAETESADPAGEAYRMLAEQFAPRMRARMNDEPIPRMEVEDVAAIQKAIDRLRPTDRWTAEAYLSTMAQLDGIIDDRETGIDMRYDPGIYSIEGMGFSEAQLHEAAAFARGSNAADVAAANTPAELHIAHQAALRSDNPSPESLLYVARHVPDRIGHALLLDGVRTLEGMEIADPASPAEGPRALGLSWPYDLSAGTSQEFTQRLERLGANTFDDALLLLDRLSPGRDVPDHVFSELAGLAENADHIAELARFPGDTLVRITPGISDRVVELVGRADTPEELETYRLLAPLFDGGGDAYDQRAAELRGE